MARGFVHGSGSGVFYDTGNGYRYFYIDSGGGYLNIGNYPSGNGSRVYPYVLVQYWSD